MAAKAVPGHAAPARPGVERHQAGDGDAGDRTEGGAGVHRHRQVRPLHVEGHRRRHVERGGRREVLRPRHEPHGGRADAQLGRMPHRRHGAADGARAGAHVRVEGRLVAPHPSGDPIEHPGDRGLGHREDVDAGVGDHRPRQVNPDRSVGPHRGDSIPRLLRYPRWPHGHPQRAA